MGLTRYKLKELVELASIRCGIQQCETISGINIFKRFMPSRNIGTDTSNYLVVPYGYFAFNLMHVGRDEKIPVAMNDTNKDIIVSPAYFVFKVIDERKLLKEYLYMIVSAPEFDRYAWFCTDSSVRGNLDWNRFCEIEINLPTLPIQQKYVDVYNAMFANQKAYETGLKDLKTTCDVYIERLRREMPYKAIGEYIEQCDERNTLNLGTDSVRGLSTNKEIITTKADLDGVGLSNYKVMKPEQIAYVADTSRRGDKIAIGFNNTNNIYLISSIYTVFNTKADKLFPAYLMMFFNRTEFDRYTRFHSWGSAREVFSWNDMREVKIPIPDIEIQQAIVNIFNAYNKRKTMVEKLRVQIKNICPILIKGAVGEA